MREQDHWTKKNTTKTISRSTDQRAECESLHGKPYSYHHMHDKHIYQYIPLTLFTSMLWAWRNIQNPIFYSNKVCAWYNLWQIYIWRVCFAFFYGIPTLLQNGNCSLELNRNIFPFLTNARLMYGKGPVRGAYLIAFPYIRTPRNSMHM